MTEPVSTKTAAQRAPRSGETLLRLDDVLIVRGTYGTWLMDLQVKVGTDRVRLQVPIGRHKALDRLATELTRAGIEKG